MSEKKTTTMFEDLVKAQEAIGVVFKDQDNPYFKSKYVDINGLLEVVKPALNKHNFAILQSLTTVDGKLGMRTMLVHTSGGKIEDFCPLPDVVDAQKAGSAITYFRRYGIQALLAVQAQDDDANSASGKTVLPSAPTATVAPMSGAKKGRKPKAEAPGYVYPTRDTDEVPFETESEKEARLAKAKEASATAPADDGLDFIGA